MDFKKYQKIYKIAKVSSHDTSDKGFSRLALGLVCFGFFGVLVRLRK